MPSVQPISAFSDNYIWVILHDDKKSFSCVDPGDAYPILAFADKEKLKLHNILLTHHHDDHIGGARELIHYFPSGQVYAPNDPRIEEIDYLSNLTAFKIDNIDFEILKTPGHTSTHISYYSPSHQWLFCGDTLFSAGCGRVFDGSQEQLLNSLMQFRNLPESTFVYCGHEYTKKNLEFAKTIEPHNPILQEYLSILENVTSCTLPSTIQLEKQINPFFRIESLEKFALEHHIDPKNKLEVFKLIRGMKDRW